MCHQPSGDGLRRGYWWMVVEPWRLSKVITVTASTTFRDVMRDPREHAIRAPGLWAMQWTLTCLCRTLWSA